MKSDCKNAQAAELQLVESDDVLFEMDDFPPILECDSVDAVCLDIREVRFTFWQTRKLVFEFSVFKPEQHAGKRLLMFVRIGNWKKRPPVSSKLAKIAKIAGCQRNFTKSAFLHKAFRCRLRKKTRGDAPYTVIDMIEKRMTGKPLVLTCNREPTTSNQELITRNQ